MKKFAIVLLVVAVLLISGCTSQPSGGRSGTQAALQQVTPEPQEPARTIGQQKQQLGPGEEYLGKADSYVISLKKFSGKAEFIATGKYSDACPIQITGQHVSSNEPGKAQIWLYKYYSKSANKALVVEVQTKQTAGGVDVYAKTKDAVVFRDEPYKRCVLPINDIDSTDAAKVVGGLSEPVTISLENNVETLRDEYEFSDGAKSIRVNAVTGDVLV